MRVLLICPINRSYVVMPRFGLGYLASVLRKAGYQVSILDCLKEKMDYSAFGQYVREADFDVVGIQMFTYDVASARKHIQIIKQLKPQVPILIGGPHPSCYADHTFQDLVDADFAFAGEAEIGLPMLIDYLAWNQRADWQEDEDTLQDIPGLIWRNRDQVMCNPPEFIKDLDSLPFPSWDLMDPNEYPPAPHGAFTKSFPVAPIITSRGCPFPCTFCAARKVTGRKSRMRSIENVMEEMELLMERYGVKEFTIEDDNFTQIKERTMEFCEAILRRGWQIHWSCPSGVRIDRLDEEMVLLMKKAGCHSLALGIESGSQRILNHMRKKITLEQIRRQTDMLAGTGVKTTAFFILGYPAETKDDLLASLKFSRELKIDRVQFNNFMPLPGSEIYDNLAEEGKLGEPAKKAYFVHDVAYAPQGISRRELKWLQRIGYLRFYLRPRIIWEILKEVRSLSHLWFLLKRVWDAWR